MNDQVTDHQQNVQEARHRYHNAHGRYHGKAIHDEDAYVRLLECERDLLRAERDALKAEIDHLKSAGILHKSHRYRGRASA